MQRTGKILDAAARKPQFVMRDGALFVIAKVNADAAAPRALSVFVPLTKESRGGHYEVTMPSVPRLKLQSYANVLALGAAEWHELTDRRGRFDAATVRKIRDAIRWMLEL